MLDLLVTILGWIVKLFSFFGIIGHGPHELTYKDFRDTARRATLKRTVLFLLAVLILGSAAAACRKSSFWSGTCLLAEFVVALWGVLTGGRFQFKADEPGRETLGVSARALVSTGVRDHASRLVRRRELRPLTSR